MVDSDPKADGPISDEPTPEEPTPEEPASGNARPAWSFTGPTAPFYDLSGGEPAKFAVRQMGDSRFVLTEGFVYDDGEDRVVVSADTLVATDLASIPLVMAWFAPVNGRHTPAALVHDTLVAEARRGYRKGVLDTSEMMSRRSRADAVFLRAMAACGVPPVRRRVMHAGVTMATRWSGALGQRLALVFWVAASVIGTSALVWAIAGGRWPVVIAALAAPLFATPLWGWRNRTAATVAGYAAWFVTLPALGTALGSGAYRIAEWAWCLAKRR